MKVSMLPVILLIAVVFVNAAPPKTLPLAITSQRETSQVLRAIRPVPLPSDDSKEALERSETAYYPYAYVYPYYYVAQYPVIVG